MSRALVPTEGGRRLVPFVGMGLTYFFKDQVYAGTIVRVSDDLQAIFFVQDRPHPPSSSSVKAFLFTPGRGSACEARWAPRGYLWGDRPVLLGLRQWITIPLRST
jgi:hypothetical protein